MTISSRFTRMTVAGISALLLVAPLCAGAQMPAPNAPAGAKAHLLGTITDFHGKYGVVVRDVHGALVVVQLRQGTVIEPIGLRLERGMVVALTGTAGAEAFAADRVDVPNAPKRRIVLMPDIGGPGSSRRDTSRSGYAGQDIPPDRDYNGPVGRPPR